MKTIGALVLTLLTLGLHAQITLTGTTNYGGPSGAGVLYQVDLAGNGELLDEWDINNLHLNEFGRMVEHSSGALIGSGGFAFGGSGVIFSYDPAANVFEEIKVMEGSGPDRVSAPRFNFLVDGDLVTACSDIGGVNQRGAIYTLDIETLDKVNIYDFSDATGGQPYSGVYEHTNGLLYGTCSIRGNNDAGTLWSFDRTSEVLTVHHHFNHSTGSFPNGGMALLNGKLYGIARSYGPNGGGSMFSIDLTTNSVSYVHNFSSPTLLRDGLATGSDGAVYGMSQTGGNSSMGFIYRYHPSAGYSVVHHFSGADGNAPNSQLVADGDWLRGGTIIGGAHNEGALFSYNVNTGVMVTEYSFEGDEGRSVRSPLCKHSNGQLYFTPYYGGPSDMGTLMAWTPGSDPVKQQDLAHHEAGALPAGGVVRVDSGDLVGMSQDSGANGWGTIYRWNETEGRQALYSFAPEDGYYPNGKLSTDGVWVYGTTEVGANYGGRLFRCHATTGQFEVLHDFSYSGLYNPVGSPRVYNNQLFGVTEGGGSNYYGGIYAYDLMTGTMSTVYNFQYTEGEYWKWPSEVVDGKLLCLASEGGANGAGSLFEFDVVAGTGQILHAFGYSGINAPFGTPVRASDGSVYGFCQYGGANYAGGIWRVDPVDGYQVVYEWALGESGAETQQMMVEYDGVLYGAVGPFDYLPGGKVFALDISTDALTEVFDLTDLGVFHPFGQLLIEEVCDDQDMDGICDLEDNCPTMANPDQLDMNTNGIGDVCDDQDMDGLTDAEEQALGTDPLNGDSDYDGWGDGGEVDNGSNPLLQDTDGDGLTDYAEWEFTETDPTLADSNSDGCNDLDQVRGLCTVCDADLDNDGSISSGDLLMILGLFGTNCE